MNLVNVTQLRNNLADYLDLVRWGKQTVNVTHQGKIVAKLIPYKEEGEEYLRVMEKAAGIFSVKTHPNLKTIGQIKKWVRTSRQKSERN